MVRELLVFYFIKWLFFVLFSSYIDRNHTEGEKFMAMHCPSCGTQDVRKVSMVYEEGVQITRSKTIFGGGLLSLFGPALGMGGAYSKGKAASLLAEKLSPPKAPKSVLLTAIKSFILGMAIGLAAWTILGDRYGIPGKKIGTIIMAILLIGLPAYKITQVVKRRKRYPAELSNWNQLFICERCGEVFTKTDGTHVDHTPHGERVAK